MSARGRVIWWNVQRLFHHEPSALAELGAGAERWSVRVVSTALSAPGREGRARKDQVLGELAHVGSSAEAASAASLAAARPDLCADFHDALLCG